MERFQAWWLIFNGKQARGLYKKKKKESLMATLVGIDEAGYGPLMGPLVVSAVVLEMPSSLLKANHWTVLQQSVSQQKKGLAGRLLIADSKKAFTRSSGIGHLRRTVLSCLSASQHRNNTIANASDIVAALHPEYREQICRYPWYAALDKHDLGHSSEDISIAAAALQKNLCDHDMTIRHIQSRCLDVELYNHRVSSVKNKSRVLFTELCSLIMNALNHHTEGTEPMNVIVDRQGGRINYQQELMRMFPGCELTTIRQDEKLSSYSLTTANKTMRIHFCVKADSAHLCAALASMASKYLREVMMESLNSYFCKLCDQLKPTAGYWEDGQRFIRDITPYFKNIESYQNKLIRIL